MELHASLLDLIARRRAETGDENLGTGAAAAILRDALSDLEQDILADPGALEAMVAPLRRSEE
jgi:hypothetical protein